jgi:hypothetical protein
MRAVQRALLRRQRRQGASECPIFQPQKNSTFLLVEMGICRGRIGDTQLRLHTVETLMEEQSVTFVAVIGKRPLDLNPAPSGPIDCGICHRQVFWQHSGEELALSYKSRRGRSSSSNRFACLAIHKDNRST